MDRPSLDHFSARHSLTRPAIDAALGLTGLRPDRAAWRRFATAAFRGTGVVALGAGIVFFIAANWQAFGVVGRFAFLQCAVLASVSVAAWQMPPKVTGQAALTLATLTVGALLALFGQTYQTGADPYELFFFWAGLALPFALAADSGALWAVWWCVLDIALGLWCGVAGTDSVMWQLLDGRGPGRPLQLMLPCLVNLAGASGVLLARRTSAQAAAPMWLAKALATIGMLWGIWAVISVITGHHTSLDSGAVDAAAAVCLFGAICAGIGIATWRRRDDAFPMALLAASGIAISTAWLVRALQFADHDLGSFFIVAAWLVAASSVAGRLLMRWAREWKTAAPAIQPGEAA